VVESGPLTLADASGTAAEPGLDAQGLAIWRGEHCLFEGLDFSIRQGQLALVVGPNGAGKTTLLRVLAGLALPTAGTVRWRGEEVRALPAERRGEIAYRGHADGLKRELTVRENLEFCRRVWNASTSTDAIAAELRLDARLDVHARNLSAGQRRRLGLACLKLGGARLWILDEPTTHLDAAGRDLVLDWIRRHADEGGCAVVATHQPDELTRAGTLVIEL